MVAACQKFVFKRGKRDRFTLFCGVLHEEGSHRLAAVDTADRFGHQRCDRNDADFLARSLRNGVGGDHFLNRGVFQPLVSQIT